jgi:hypothetical protein
MSHRSADSRITGRPVRAGRIIGWIFIWLLLLLLTGWGIMAILYSNLPPSLQPWAAGAFGAISLLLPLLVRPRRRGVIASLCIFALLVAWWLTIPPANARDWQPDVAVLPRATVAGEKVTIHNIRNCDYRSETDYTCHYYDRTFDLARLKSADLFLIYWGSPYIAHTMLSSASRDRGRSASPSRPARRRGKNTRQSRAFSSSTNSPILWLMSAMWCDCGPITARRMSTSTS